METFLHFIAVIAIGAWTLMAVMVAVIVGGWAIDIINDFFNNIRR